MSQPEPDLVERDELLDGMRMEIKRAVRRGGRLVFLSGPAGVGKTSLVRELARRPGVSIRVMWGMCDALTTPRALGPLLDMATTSPILTDLLESDVPRHEVFAGLLSDISERPTLLVIEDVHWADEATLDLILFLGRRVEGTRSLIVLTYRDDEIIGHHPLRRVMGDLATSGGQTRRVVEPLTLEGVRTLVGDRSVDPERLYRTTGGNPFYVTEVLAKPGWMVPPTVVDAVVARLDRLTGAERSVVQAVSTDPTSGLERDILRDLGHDDAVIDDIVVAGFLVPSGDKVAFRHELARRAVYQTFDDATRRSLHLSILNGLEDRPGVEPSRLAHHAERADDPAALLDWSIRAGEVAQRQGAHRQAVEHLGLAVAHSASMEPVSRIDLMSEYATELMTVDRSEESLAVRHKIVDLARDEGDEIAIIEAKSNLAGAMWMVGDGEGTWRLMNQVMEKIDAIPTGLTKAAVYHRAGRLAMLARRGDEAIEWSARAVSIAEVSPNHTAERILADSLNVLGSARLVNRRDPMGRDDLERSRMIAQRNGWDLPYCNALLNLGSGLGEIRQYELSAEYLVRGIDYASEHDLDAYWHYCQAWLSRVRFEQGRWGEAVKLATGIPLERVTPISSITALATLGRVSTRRGDRDGKDALERAWELALATDDLQRLWPVAAGRAEMEWLRSGEVTTAAKDVKWLLERAVDLGVGWAIGELGVWAAMSGEPPADLTEVPEPYRLRMEGDHLQAAMVWNELGCPYEEAWELIDAGDERSLRRALEILVPLSARPLADRARKLLRELGARQIPGRPRRSTRENPLGLTRRQSEVLELLVEGLTDREIADRLFISTKTAGHHVSAVIAKLGVSTRVEAAIVAQEKMGDP